MQDACLICSSQKRRHQGHRNQMLLRFKPQNHEHSSNRAHSKHSLQLEASSSALFFPFFGSHWTCRHEGQRREISGMLGFNRGIALQIASCASLLELKKACQSARDLMVGAFQTAYNSAEGCKCAASIWPYLRNMKTYHMQV